MHTNRPETPPAHDAGHLANRVTLLTLASLCCLLLGALSMPLTFQSTERTTPRVLSGTPVAAGVGAAVLARGARARLRAAREQEETAASAAEPGDPGRRNSRTS
ncbi:hypothetical protein [Anaeromyxobacter terrae]|uniref:hypothetical protein n=1 Tax=Anaeromyxobacter terrae TaxID=2925406 RepID=UPI001F566CF9|nr:hypothetical protein [Anaeromyxobacter sp. SG22]